VEGSRIFIPHEKAKENINEEMLAAKRAKIEKLKKEQQEARYWKLVGNVDSHYILQENIRDVKEIRDLRTSLSVGTNIIATVVTVFIAGWFLFSRAYDNVVGIIAGMLCSIVALFIEVWLFIIRGLEIDSPMDSKKNRYPKRSLK